MDVTPSPWARPEDDTVDVEALERLQAEPLPRTRSLQARIVQSAASRLEKTPSLQRASSELRESVKAALERTTSFKSAISRTSSAGARELISAIKSTKSGDFKEASAQVEVLWGRFEKGSLAHAIARVLVCIFFLDCCIEKYQNWKFYQTPFMRQRVENYPQRYKDIDPGYPYFQLMVVLPCAFLTMVGVGTRITASILVLDMLRDGTGIIISGMRRVIQHRLEPDELTAKHLAMLGSAVLVLAHTVRDRYATSNTVAGLLIGEPDRAPSHLKSLVLLFSRLALTLLFVTVGISQVKRVIQRDWAIYAKRELLRRDGHDNNFLLVEAFLAIPFAIGYRTRVVAPLLALALLLEALLCWWPLESWPSVQYQSHVRSHFATNVGVAGGLLLLQTYGAGRYTVDKLIALKKNV